MFLSKDAAIKELFGPDVSVAKKTPVSGGDINVSSLLWLSDGRKVFLKENPSRPEVFFEAEAQGLSMIAATKTLRTPKVLALGQEDGTAFLMLEQIQQGGRSAGFFHAFGRALALFHRADTGAFVSGGRFGLSIDNYIGATPQRNTPADSWLSFYRDSRLKPQFEMAERYFDQESRRKVDQLLSHLDRWLSEPAYPSLLHGDLWSGNYLIDENGDPALIDPAVYVGAAETDLAMTELFGGFPRDFYQGYREESGDLYGYEDRKPLYQLYHLLNHLNLFGPSYLDSVLSIVYRYSS